MGAVIVSYIPFSIPPILNYVTTYATPISGNKPPLNYMEIIKPEVKPLWKKLKNSLKIKN